MKMEKMMKKLQDAVAADGYGTIAEEIGIGKSTLWRICRGKPIPAMIKAKIEAWLERSEEGDIVVDGPVPELEEKTRAEAAKESLSEIEKLREEVIEKLSAVQHIRDLQMVDLILILSRKRPFKITFEM